MKSKVVYSTRNLVIAVCAFLAGALVLAPSASLQEGGNFSLRPSIVPGGGGASASCTKRIEGSIGQTNPTNSSSPQFTVESGLWPNSVTCPLAVSPTTQFFSTAGGTGSINVIAAGSCGWSASLNADWITLTSGDTGTGNDVITFEVRQNFTRSPRQASINVGGVAQLIVQDAGLENDCSYSISPLFQAVAASGGSGSIKVIAEDRCAWQAFSSVGWVTITSPNVGIGWGTVHYCVEANSGASGRTGSLIIAGKAFVVKQKGN